MIINIYIYKHDEQKYEHPPATSSIMTRFRLRLYIYIDKYIAIRAVNVAFTIRLSRLRFMLRLLTILDLRSSSLILY